MAGDPDQSGQFDDDHIRECIRRRERAIEFIDEIDKGRREFEKRPDGSQHDITAKVRADQVALVGRYSQLIRTWGESKAQRARSLDRRARLRGDGETGPMSSSPQES